MSPVCCDFFLCAKVLQGASDDPYLVPSCVTWGLFFMGLEKVPSGEGSFPKYNEEPGLDRRESMRKCQTCELFCPASKEVTASQPRAPRSVAFHVPVEQCLWFHSGGMEGAG